MLLLPGHRRLAGRLVAPAQL